MLALATAEPVYVCVCMHLSQPSPSLAMQSAKVQLLFLIFAIACFAVQATPVAADAGDVIAGLLGTCQCTQATVGSSSGAESGYEAAVCYDLEVAVARGLPVGNLRVPCCVSACS